MGQGRSLLRDLKDLAELTAFLALRLQNFPPENQDVATPSRRRHDQVYATIDDLSADALDLWSG